MESSKNSTTAKNNGEEEFNAVSFEKKLLQLKDSQESINALSAWCLEHRQHHKKIVTAWLNVLKKVKVEQRLTLFYLANDVIQYSKRKNYDFVASWGTTLQKATPMVREDKVKHKILRIFKIWEQRSIYSEDFLADLSGLLSASTIPQKPDASQEFQPNYLITRIRSCAKLEENTDLKLKQLKDGSPKITDIDSLMTQLKDRRHVEDVEREVEEGIALIEGYANALKSEIKSRAHLITVLSQAETFYQTERGEVKVVANAYRNFSTRVKNLKKKLDEIIPTLSSPIPSPDVNAPSPEPDSDLELSNDIHNSTNLNNLYNLSNDSNLYPITEQYTAGYYNQVQDTQSTSSFQTNTFSSFMNSTDVPFDIANLYSDRSNDSYKTQQQDMSVPPPEPVKAPYDTSYRGPPQPLQPPPMPPFTSSSYMDAPHFNADNSYSNTNSYSSSTAYNPVSTNNYAVSSQVQSSYMTSGDAYNPEEELETWEGENSWDRTSGAVDLETPESPPIFEKESYSNPIEYDDSKIEMAIGEKDVDHRVLLPPPIPPQLTDHRLPRSNSKDVDHRNLISLTGSPGNDSSAPLLEPPPAPPDLWTGADQDYRNPIGDIDYRITEPPPQLIKDTSPLVQIPTVDIPIPNRRSSPPMSEIAQQLQLPPPPPPPPPNRSPNKIKKPAFHDNNESIDMDLSDDESPVEAATNLNGPPLLNHLEGAPITAGKIENGPLLPMTSVPPPMVPPVGWNEPEWFNGRPVGPPPTQDMRFPHPGNMGGGKFRGGFRGRGGQHDQHHRGRGRGGPFRGGQNNWSPNNRGFQRGGRGFRPPMPHFGRAEKELPVQDHTPEPIPQTYREDVEDLFLDEEIEIPQAFRKEYNFLRENAKSLTTLFENYIQKRVSHDTLLKQFQASQENTFIQMKARCNSEHELAIEQDFHTRLMGARGAAEQPEMPKPIIVTNKSDQSRAAGDTPKRTVTFKLP